MNGCLVHNCHYAQDTKSQRTKKFLALAHKAIAVFPLTGTPMKNGKPSNLFPLLKAIRHPLGTKKHDYEVRYCEGKLERLHTRSKGDIIFWKADGAENLDELRAAVGPNVIRRRKRECLDLPKKTRVLRDVDVPIEAEEAYKKTIDKCRDQYRNKADAGLVLPEAEALVMLTAMRKAASLAKIEAAVELVEEIVQSYDGSLPVNERDGIVKQFQVGAQRTFVGTLGTGGLGLTLTAASTVILVDRPMTPGDADQAESRVDRIGQHWPVTAIWLRAFQVCRMLDEILVKKLTVIGQVIDGGSDSSAITASQVVLGSLRSGDE